METFVIFWTSAMRILPHRAKKRMRTHLFSFEFRPSMRRFLQPKRYARISHDANILRPFVTCQSERNFFSLFVFRVAWHAHAHNSYARVHYYSSLARRRGASRNVNLSVGIYGLLFVWSVCVCARSKRLMQYIDTSILEKMDAIWNAANWQWDKCIWRFSKYVCECVVDS